jgi:hypothetical protein
MFIKEFYSTAAEPRLTALGRNEPVGERAGAPRSVAPVPRSASNVQPAVEFFCRPAVRADVSTGALCSTIAACVNVESGGAFHLHRT